MNDFNNIGISRQLDWPRIRKLLAIGLFAAALLGLIGSDKKDLAGLRSYPDAV